MCEGRTNEICFLREGSFIEFCATCKGRTTEFCILGEGRSAEVCVMREGHSIEVCVLREGRIVEIRVLHESSKTKSATRLEFPFTEIELRKDKALKMSLILPGFCQNPLKLQPECIEERSRLLAWILRVHQADGILVCPF